MPSNKSKNAASKSGGDGGAAQVQDAFDEANEKGFFGTEVDQTPNSAYSVTGVTANEPTPETELQGEAAVDAKEAE